MAKNIPIMAGDVAIDVALNNTDTAGVIWDLLPIRATSSTWGNEIYFRIEV